MQNANVDIIKGKWLQLKGDVKAKWGRLTDDDLDIIDGNREKLLSRIQETYGVVRKEAEDQLKDWEKNYTH